MVKVERIDNGECATLQQFKVTITHTDLSKLQEKQDEKGNTEVIDLQRLIDDGLWKEK